MLNLFVDHHDKGAPVRIDTARIYAGGDSEKMLGRALANLEGVETMALGTKAHPSQVRSALVSCAHLNAVPSDATCCTECSHHVRDAPRPSGFAIMKLQNSPRPRGSGAPSSRGVFRRGGFGPSSSRLSTP